MPEKHEAVQPGPGDVKVGGFTLTITGPGVLGDFETQAAPLDATILFHDVSIRRTQALELAGSGAWRFDNCEISTQGHPATALTLEQASDVLLASCDVLGGIDPSRLAGAFPALESTDSIVTIIGDGGPGGVVRKVRGGGTQGEIYCEGRSMSLSSSVAFVSGTAIGGNGQFAQPSCSTFDESLVLQNGSHAVLRATDVISNSGGYIYGDSVLVDESSVLDFVIDTSRAIEVVLDIPSTGKLTVSANHGTKAFLNFIFPIQNPTSTTVLLLVGTQSNNVQEAIYGTSVQVDLPGVFTMLGVLAADYAAQSVSKSFDVPSLQPGQCLGLWLQGVFIEPAIGKVSLSNSAHVVLES